MTNWLVHSEIDNWNGHHACENISIRLSQIFKFCALCHKKATRINKRKKKHTFVIWLWILPPEPESTFKISQTNESHVSTQTGVYRTTTRKQTQIQPPVYKICELKRRPAVPLNEQLTPSTPFMKNVLEKLIFIQKDSNQVMSEITDMHGSKLMETDNIFVEIKKNSTIMQIK